LIPADRLGPRKLSAVVLGFLGVVVILQPWQAQGRPDLLGFGMTLVAGASYGLGWTYLKRFLGPGDVGGLGLPAAQLMMSSVQLVVVTTIWWLLHRDGGNGPAAPWSPTSGTHVGASVLAVVVLGVVGTGLAFALQFDIVRAVGPTVGATVTYVIPVVAVALGVVFLHERLHWPQVLGAIIVLAAALAIGTPSRRRRGETAKAVVPTPPA
ncbi:MAG: DMT family transporter, partial [Lapillicoccus sp.]